MRGEPAALPGSAWLHSAGPAPATQALQGDLSADVLGVGAGFTGLSAALHLAEAGTRVVVVDAVEPGWGASGRNNGQVIPGLKFDPDELERRYGTETGRKLAQWSGEAPGLVFELIDKHRIACHPVREGWIQPAYTKQAVGTIQSRYSQWSQRGAPVEMLPTPDLPRILGTSAFHAAWLDRRGGTINPLGYARGLASAAMHAGALLFSRTCVESLARDETGWLARSAKGSVRAGRVFMATAAYVDDIVPGLRTSFVPVRTAQVATAPLPAAQRDAILPGRQGASDTRRLLTSFRLSPDGRLVMGGSGATGTLDHGNLLPRLHKAAAEMFPHLGSLPWELGWSGYFAVTKDHLPHLHESADGITCALGCNGRGIAVSTAMGKLVAQRMLGNAEDTGVAATTMQSYPFYAFRNLGIWIATRVEGMKDRRDREAA